MNKFLQGMDLKLTENGSLAHSTTWNAVYDLFAFGGAYRTRSDADVWLLFRQAFLENETMALKCLFYLRDILQGQGERRFFRVCMRELAKEFPEAAKRNMAFIPDFGRWDDLFVFVNTPLEADAFAIIRMQLALDVQSKTPSLLAKWMKSINTSSSESRMIAKKTANYLGWTAKQYRKTLAILRDRIRIVEKLMSENRWDEIEFDKIPSKAGLKYRNAFARRDILAKKYEAFAKDKNTKVNAKTLYPYEVVVQANSYAVRHDMTQRAMVNKYWDNLTDYFNEKTFNGLAVVDTSGSMTWHDVGGAKPIDVAISLGLYCAERAKGPFAGHYISFASRPQLIRTEGIDFVDKVQRIYNTNLCDNTNLEATFNMLLDVAVKNNCTQEELPENIIIISDMEIDAAEPNVRRCWGENSTAKVNTIMENQRVKWASAGYKMPKLVYWNVEARQNTILDASPDVSYVSGFSPSIFEQIMTGKTGVQLMEDKLMSDRYALIQ